MADTTTELEVLDDIVDVLGGTSGQYETVVPVLQQIKELLGGITDMRAELDAVADFVRGKALDVSSWSESAALASSGKAIKSMLVNSQLIDDLNDTHASPATTYEMPWDIADFQTGTLEDESTLDVMVLQAHFCLPFATQFDAMEAFYAVPAGGLAAGTYHVTFGVAYRDIPEGASYQFTLANSYEEGAQLCFSDTIYSKVPSAMSVDAYATAGATERAERVSVSVGTGGTSLGTITGAQVQDGDQLNSVQRIALGSGRWLDSNLRQFLNATATSGWFVPKTKWDRPPSYVSYPGFLSMLPAELVAVMRPIRQVTATSYYADGGSASQVETDVTYDKVFLPSWEQHNITPSASYGGAAGVEGAAWGKWSSVVSSVPSSGSTVPEYIQRDLAAHTARSVWMRSCLRYGGSTVTYVSSAGTCTTYGASTGGFAALACAIG